MTQTTSPLGSIFCYTGLKHPSGKKQRFPIKKKWCLETSGDVKAPQQGGSLRLQVREHIPVFPSAQRHCSNLQKSFRTDCKYPFRHRETRYTSQIGNAEHGRETPLLESQEFPFLPPLLLEEAAAALRLLFAARSLASLNYSMRFCCSVAAGVPWDSSDGTWHLETRTKTG